MLEGLAPRASPLHLENWRKLCIQLKATVTMMRVNGGPGIQRPTACSLACTMTWLRMDRTAQGQPVHHYTRTQLEQQGQSDTHFCLGPVGSGSCTAPATATCLALGLARTCVSTTIALAARSAAALLRACLMAERLMNSGGLRPCCWSPDPSAPLGAAPAVMHDPTSGTIKTTTQGVLCTTRF